MVVGISRGFIREGNIVRIGDEDYLDTNKILVEEVKEDLSVDIVDSSRDVEVKEEKVEEVDLEIIGVDVVMNVKIEDE